MTHDGRRRTVLCLLILTLGSLALPTCSAITPRNGWDERWGPLVPHKTFPTDCSICHVPDRWDVLKQDFSFDHEKETGHALDGAHEKAACLRCHNDFGPITAYTSRGCAGCHADPHRAQLGGTCTQCHNEDNWRPGGLIAEHARTRFPLVGVHAIAACALCHKRAPAGEYTGAPTECEACHRDDLARATSPDHQANGWVQNCQRCHRPTAWDGAEFSHEFFPLTGRHGVIACDACHVGGDFKKLPTACYSCHQSDYESAPDHGGFPQTCQNCHNTSTWEGATFAHTTFPLTGRHGQIACSACHIGGDFGTKPPTACYSCHQSDYEGAPNHGGFPQTCQNCHSTSTWQGATFNHTFPIGSGPHRVDCSVCHVGGNTQTFTCLVCHDHRQSEMDDKHKEVRNYRYESSSCLQCHRNGRD